MIKHPPLQPLLPDDKFADRPLFMVLAILAFLATITLLAAKLSYSQAGQWGEDLNRTASVQIKPVQSIDAAAQAQAAKEIIAGQDGIAKVSIMPQSYSADLLKPWLGETALPDDLPLPVLLHVELEKNKKINTAQTKAALSQAGIIADIDDHSQWTKELRETARAAQTIAILAFILIMVAINGAAVFATRAAITGRETLMEVLQQVGALPSYTAKIFSIRCARTSLKAGAMGTIGAFLLLILLSLFGSTPGLRYFMPGVQFGFTDFLLTLLIPIAMAVISAITAWRTVKRIILEKMYP